MASAPSQSLVLRDEGVQTRARRRQTMSQIPDAAIASTSRRPPIHPTRPTQPRVPPAAETLTSDNVRIEQVDVPPSIGARNSEAEPFPQASGMTAEALRDIIRNEFTSCLVSMAGVPPHKRKSRAPSLDREAPEEVGVSDDEVEPMDPLQISDSPSSPRFDPRQADVETLGRNMRPRGTSTPTDEFASLRAEIQAMRSEVHQASSCAPDIRLVLQTAQNTPFTRRVSRARIPNPGKLKLPMYAGNTDPGQHLTAFSIAIGRCHLSGSDADAAKCQLFVETLEGSALTWFSRMATHSIDSFQQLSTAFLTHYSMYIQQRASDADLWNVIQNSGEPLRDYLDRFKRVASQVHVSDTTALAALRRGLLIESRFYEDLSINHPRNLENALHRGAAFVSMEEDKKAALSRTAHLNPRTSHPASSNAPRGQQQPASRFGPPRQATYAISDETRGTNTWVRPGSAYDSGSGQNEEDPSAKYCEYHKLNGHNTTECRHLQEYLFSLLHNGTIALPERPPRNNRQQTRRTFDGGRPRNAEANPRTPTRSATPAPPPGTPNGEPAPGAFLPPPPSPPRTQRINVIMGGLEGCEDSVRSIRVAERKAAAPSARLQIPEFEIYNDKLSFCDSDAAGLHFPHNDPLVIDLSIGECCVSRVLVDTGSTVDLIYWPTLEKMGIPRTSLKPNTRPLTGFAGTVEHTIGTVKLVVTAGRVPQIVKFVVVNQQAPYNAIMGTPWIHRLKAVVSTYHQCLKFPTPYGIYTLRGNQQVSRSCFALEHKLRHANMCHAARPPPKLGARRSSEAPAPLLCRHNDAPVKSREVPPDEVLHARAVTTSIP